MADGNAIGGASSSGISSESLESTLEVNVKTLDSQIYSFRVDKNMPVPLLKEKIASAAGVPVEQQRLIFRGKVLKDDHLLSEYHVEDGHTLHLVARQPVQSGTPTGTNTGETNVNHGTRGNDSSTAAPRSRTGQISHSVVLGTFNIGDQGEGVVPDVSRIIGAVLNSIGIGSQIPSGGAGNIAHSMPANASSQVSQGVETEGTRGNAGGRSQSGNLPPVQTFSNHPFQSLPQSLQFPMMGAAVSGPTPQMSIPDSVHTISEFINRMETALSVNGNQPSSSSSVGDLPTMNLPSNERGLPTPEALSIIIQRAQQLLSVHTATALSRIAERLEGEQSATDPAVRSQIQIEAAQTGLAVQHLGALLLELGRTILTLRMGQSPAESSVNAGPAVYISPSGPNLIMVQPFPHQTSSLFGGSAASQANSAPVGPISIGDTPRNINIHIHAVGSRANSGEATPQEQTDAAHSGDPSQTRMLPGRNIIAAAIPSRSTGHVLSVLHPSNTRSQQNNQSQAPAQGSGVAISSSTQASGGDSVTRSQPESVAIPSLVAQINARIRNLVDNARGENQIPSGQFEGSTVDSSLRELTISQDTSSHQHENISIDGSSEISRLFTQRTSGKEEQQQPECCRSGNNGDKSGDMSTQATSADIMQDSSTFPGGGRTVQKKTEDGSDDALKCTESHETSPADGNVPLGLGMGGLQYKRKVRQARSQMKHSDGKCSDTPDNNSQQTISSGQQVLRSILSRGSSANERDSGGAPSGQTSESIPMRSSSSSGQFDVASMMSQVLNSPALDGLLSGVSQQAGIGSSDGLRNMLEQFTQSPSMKNTLNNIVQQIDGQDFSNLSGLGRDQGGGLDLSRMVQQMMPIVSQALTRGSTQSESFHDVDSEAQKYHNVTGPVREETLDNHHSQNDLQHVAERIERHDPPGDIFRSVVEHITHDGNITDDFVQELCSDEDLVNEFMEMLYRNIGQRLS